MSMLRELECSLLTSYSHCCHSCGNICTSFPWLLPSYRSSFPCEHIRNSKMDDTSFQAWWSRAKNLYVTSIVKRYKGRRGEKVRRLTQVERDEGRNKDSERSSVARLFKRTWPSPFCLSVSPFSPSFLFFSRVYKHELASLSTPLRDIRTLDNRNQPNENARQAVTTRSLIRQKGLLFERIVISLRYIFEIYYMTFLISLSILQHKAGNQ